MSNMASYKEYQAKYVTDNQEQSPDLTQQIDEAATNQAQREQAAVTEIPERFQGKSLDDVVHSYTELESAYGRMSQTIGEQRKTIDGFLELQGTSPISDTPQQEYVPADVDALYEDADGTIRRLAREETDARVRDLEAQLSQINANSQISELDGKHPGWRETVKEPEFVNWLQEAPYRVRLVQEADKGDFGAADDVLNMYKDTATTHRRDTVDTQRKQDLANATLQSTVPNSTTHADSETFSRVKLTDVRMRANRGDGKAEDWLKANGEQIRLAYANNRITD
jgi:hypothetical protein